MLSRRNHTRSSLLVQLTISDSSELSSTLSFFNWILNIIWFLPMNRTLLYFFIPSVFYCFSHFPTFFQSTFLSFVHLIFFVVHIPQVQFLFFSYQSGLSICLNFLNSFKKIVLNYVWTSLTAFSMVSGYFSLQFSVNMFPFQSET